MPEYRNLKRPWLVSALLILAVLAAFAPVYFLGFINFDDTFYVTKNPHVQQGLSWKGIQWAFTQFHAANWHPLTWMSHMLDFELYGLNPLGHHLTNVFFHAANTVILFLWLRSATGATWRSALVAALFGLHPLRVESVAWVAERKDVLSTLFGLLSLWAYTRYGQTFRSPAETAETGSKKASKKASAAQPTKKRSSGPRAGLYCLSLVLFALGLLSKPMLVTWPFLMLLLDYWPLGRIGVAAPMGGPETEGFDFKRLTTLVAEKLPFFLLSAGSCVVTFFAQRAGGAVSAVGGKYGVTIGLRLGNVPVSYARYLLKTVWPEKLTVIYPLVRDLPVEDILVSVIVLGVLTALVLWRGRRNAYLPVGWFWFLGAAVPVIGLVQVGTQSIADRYTYIPSIGLFILLVWGLADLAGHGKQSGLALKLATAGALLMYVWLDGRQLLYWQNSEALFRRALAVTSKNYMANALLGSYYSDLGDLEPAKACYYRALEVAPEVPNVWNNLGCALVAQKRYPEAIDAFEKSLQSNSSSAEAAQSNLGNALFGLGRMKEAVEHYREAVRIAPDNPDSQYNLGNMLSRMNQPVEAAEHFRIALKLDPHYANAHAFLGTILAQQGKPEEAASEFQSALAIDPNSTVALYGYAQMLAGEGKWKEAEEMYSQLVRRAPADNVARLQLGIAQAAQTKLEEAIRSFLAILDTDPTNVTANFQAAAALAAQHKCREAIERYRAAIKAAPDFAEALNNLAWMLAANPSAEFRDGPEAVKLAEKACQLTKYKEPLVVGTLAAAYAEAGRFPDAITAAEKAKALAESAGNTELTKKNAELLALYRAGKPYRDPN